MCCSAQTKFKPTVKLPLSYFFTEGDFYDEYRHRAVIGTGLRHFNFDNAKVFELFRRRVFNRAGYFGVNAPSVDVKRWI
jgi:hypothetical protein